MPHLTASPVPIAFGCSAMLISNPYSSASSITESLSKPTTNVIFGLIFPAVEQI